MDFSKEQLECDYDRYVKLCEFAGKKVPQFTEYVKKKGLRVEDYVDPEEVEILTPEELKWALQCVKSE